MVQLWVSQKNKELKGDVRITSHGYRSLYVGTSYPSPRVKSGRIYEHHYVAETEILNAPLDRKQCVHHIDFDKQNNKVDNLDILTIKEHNQCHADNSFIKELYALGMLSYCRETKRYVISDKLRSLL